eukprot:TRINITY_DN9461_c0_g1_i1.p1 TRINITY_DN9461_c0_g1~~TRINITY_DN9461_c0_g1_i1.p1  ORF type:complete len:437 (+),score=80.60 TRINITY_DN9461_c0_g1_i1:82-1311(+)
MALAVKSTKSHLGKGNATYVVKGGAEPESEEMDAKPTAEPESEEMDTKPTAEHESEEMDAKPKQETPWSARSAFPKYLQLFFAISWIFLLGAVPLLITHLDKKRITSIQLNLSFAMWLMLFGGLFLFTNVIVFKSPHFDTERPLTMIECIYFMSQIIATVGYGDITPSRDRGEIFVGLYVLCAILFISNVMFQLRGHLAIMTEKFDRQVQEAVRKHIIKNDENVSGESSLHILLGKPPRADKAPLLQSLLVFIALHFPYIAFFTLWPGEGKTLIEAMYMSLITFSTVGLGAVTPATESGMIFDAFFMLIGAAALVNIIGSFTEYATMSRHHEQFDGEIVKRSLKKLRGKEWGGEVGKVTQAEFIIFGLVSQGLVSDCAVKSIQATFQSMQPQAGLLDLAKIEQAALDLD